MTGDLVVRDEVILQGAGGAADGGGGSIRAGGSRYTLVLKPCNADSSYADTAELYFDSTAQRWVVESDFRMEGAVDIRGKPAGRVHVQATAPTGVQDGDLWVDTSPGGGGGAIGGSLGSFDQMPEWGAGTWRTFLSTDLRAPAGYGPFYVQAWARGELVRANGDGRWDMVVKCQDDTKNIIMAVALPYTEAGAYMNTSMGLFGPFPDGGAAAIMVGAQRPYGSGTSRTAWNCQAGYLIIPARR
jgi:hypothetical protein